MYETFENLQFEKRKKILNACYDVFGKYGYEKASINDIAKEAHVSKSSLFHYFINKENLYFYLYDFATLKIADNMQEGTEDLFESISLSTKLKFEIFKDYPSMFNFLKSIILESENLQEKLRNRNYDKVTLANKLLFKNVDWTKLNTNNIQDVINLLSWISEGCIKANINLNPEQIVEEVNKYLEYVKKATYKEEYL